MAYCIDCDELQEIYCKWLEIYLSPSILAPNTTLTEKMDDMERTYKNNSEYGNGIRYDMNVYNKIMLIKKNAELAGCDTNQWQPVAPPDNAGFNMQQMKRRKYEV